MPDYAAPARISSSSLSCSFAITVDLVEAASKPLHHVVFRGVSGT